MTASPWGRTSTATNPSSWRSTTENPAKDIPALDIPLPRLTRRYSREFKDLTALDPATLGNTPIPLKSFSEEETREIVFKKMLDSEVDHMIRLDSSGKADWRSVVGFYSRQLLKEMRLIAGYEFIYPAVRDFMKNHLFENSPVDLEDPAILRNLSEPAAGKILFDSFKKGINALTVRDEGNPEIEGYHLLRETRPFRTAHREFLTAEKSVFNRIVGEVHSGGLELAFATFLENAPDCQAFAKNYLAVGFRIDYVKKDGDLSTYTPDFIARDTSGTVWIIETKGREELDVPQKMSRLALWCHDATAAGKETETPTTYNFLYIDQESFEKHHPATLADLATSFTEYK